MGLRPGDCPYIVERPDPDIQAPESDDLVLLSLTQDVRRYRN